MDRRKLTKQDIDKVRNIEGFPNGTDEDIIALSDAPYYTACPNPFIEEFISEKGAPYEEANDNYHREPFSSDVSEGKGDLIYRAHNYHTKVPYKAIMRYILHYTEPGDIVYDGFSGTGMTGVAAQMCGSSSTSLKMELLSAVPDAKWGTRKAILNDLSPVASFISYNQNYPVNGREFERLAKSILDAFERDCGWMYETKHKNKSEVFLPIVDDRGFINYVVWSDVLLCPHCSNEIVFSEVAFDAETKRVSDSFVCPCCKSRLTKKACSNAMEMVFDKNLGSVISIAKQKPILINYTYQGKKYEKRPDENDLSLIKRINEMDIKTWYPTSRMPEGGESRRNDKYGITHVHHFYTKRSIAAISYLMEKVEASDNPLAMRFLFEQIILGMAKISRYVPAHFSQVNQYLSGTLYIGSQVVEVSPEYIIKGKVKNLSKMFNEMDFERGNVCISTGSTTQNNIPSNSIDYIFTDPPFGSNLNYSELNYFWEAWMRCTTNSSSEAIVNEAVGKKLVDYQSLMAKCFSEYYRVLKPNRWITIEFHNSKNAVWNAIQEVLQTAGFIVADVRTLDKKQGTFKQINSASAVKQDLVISAYKPMESFSKEFKLKVGTESTAWSFVRQHLSNLSITVKKGGKLEVIAERQAFLLWDRMVAYHIMRGIAVPMDASTFYQGLDEKFLKRDGMYFLSSQVNKYDKIRATCDVENIQFSLFVTDEKSAIGWLYQQLDERSGDGPQTYAELMPKFVQELKAVDKREKMPELLVILEENFLKDNKGKWYIPDYTKSGDIAKLREKNLLKEFQEYQATKGKLKVFRSEAIRAGFAKLWKDKDYQAIVTMAERLPEETIQEDSNLLMYYDISLSRV